MRGARTRGVAGAVATLALAVPVATAGAHSADFAFSGAVAQQIGAYQGGASMFMQRAPDTPGAFTLVGHNPLENRGMNAAIAVNKGFVYVGSRTDGSNGRLNAGIKIIDARNPAKPTEAGEMKPPLEGNPQESSRELRVWRSQDVLIVLHTNCGGQSAHLCQQPNRSSMRFYDIKGENAANPQLLHQNTRDTHEFFIWEDPKNPKRALMFEASAGSQFAIYDLSPLLNTDAATRAPVRLFQGAHGFGNSSGSGIHSFSVSNDGTRAYFALLTRGFGVVDVSDFTDTDPTTNTYSLVTPAANRVQCTARSSSGTRTPSTCPTRSTAPRPRPATAARGVGRASSTSPTRPSRRSSASTGCRRTSRSAARRSIRRGRPTPRTTRR